MEVQDHRTLAELLLLERDEKHANQARRLRIISLALPGWTAPSMAMAVGLSRRICQRWVAPGDPQWPPDSRYNKSGLEGLTDRRGRAAGLPFDATQQAAVQARIDASPTDADGVCTLRGRDLQRILADEFQVLRSLPSVYWLLHWLSYSCLRPRPKHRRSDPEQIAAFRAQWPERLRTMSAQHPGRRLRVYVQDESRFGQQGTNTQVWARRGSRPTPVGQTKYDDLWVIGAAGPETGHAEGLLSPQLNTAVINVFLRQFAQTIPPEEHAVPIWDGAGFHTAKTLQVPANITLVPVPPYSPELNPIENLWHYLKSHYWSNRSYDSYADLEAAALSAWQTAVLNPELMQTVRHAPYLTSAASG